jgi:hypothetical protein
MSPKFKASFPDSHVMINYVITRDKTVLKHIFYKSK